VRKQLLATLTWPPVYALVRWRCVRSVDLCSWCRPYAEKYAKSQEEFFKDYAESHKKLSELGVQWDEGPVDWPA
jgi:hypothetical protein